MRKSIISFSIFVTSVMPLLSQTATSLNLGGRVNYNSATDRHEIRWWSKNAYFYFLLETTDLVDVPWTYFPYATLGNDAIKGVDIQSNSPLHFFRIEWSNDTNSPMLLHDYDGDLVGTIDELLQGTDPFLASNSDGDSIPDDWEAYYGVTDASADEEPDGMKNGTEFILKRNPSVADHPDLELEIF